MRAVLLSCLLLACSGSGATPAPAPVLAPETLRTVCAVEPCGSPSASVIVYRDASGVVARLERRYGACDHSPTLFLSPDGTVVDIVLEEPVIPGSPEAASSRVRTEGWTAGLTATDLIRCHDGARLDPPR